MDLRRLKTFITVAEHGTVSKAAEVLHITQPALSRQIGGLEQELGFELFQRAGRRLLLTPRGEQLLGDCRSLLAHAGMVGERAQALRRGELKVLRVATSALTIEGLFPIFLHRYAQRFPGVRLALIEADAAEHLTMLEQGEADLAISVLNVVPVDEHRFASHLLPLFQMFAACAPTFDIEQTDTIEIRDLVQHPCCCRTRPMRRATCSMRRAVLPACDRMSWPRAAPRTRCWRSPRKDTVWRSSPRSCAPIAARSGSCG